MKMPQTSIRIPTPLALVLLFTALVLGVVINLYNSRLDQNIESTFSQSAENIEIVNLTDTSVSLMWQTAAPADQQLLWGSDVNTLDYSQKDDRNETSEQNRITHAITIKNLQPNTSYFYKIKEGSYQYPSTPKSFKTAPKIANPPEARNSPIVGRVIEDDLKVSAEGLVFLKIAGAAPVGTSLTTAGNFIMPLANLRSEDLSQLFTIPAQTEGTITIVRGEKISQIKLILPQQVEVLPPIILGQNSDFSQPIEASGSATINPLDLNSDGTINSVDLSIVILNLDKTGDQPSDLNKDGVVDDQDVQKIKDSLN